MDTENFLSSFYSLGWYNADEQTCILEFVNFKLGFESNPCFLNIKDNSVIIDSSLKIRSWIQPFFYYLITKILFFLNFQDPIKITQIIKIITSLIAFFSSYYFYVATKNHFKNSIVKKIYLYLSFLIFYIVFFHTRTSAENFGISFLMIGLAFYFTVRTNFNYKNAFFMGLIFGFSFVFRYNLGVSIFFILLYFFIFDKKSTLLQFGYLFSAIIGIFIVVMFDIIIATWGLGNTNDIKLGNFLNLNFLEDRIASLQFLLCGVYNNLCGGGSWNPKPTLYYFPFILYEFFPPLSIVIIISMIFFWSLSIKNIIFWTTLPYFIIHSFIAHKELRFIFPVLAFTPYFIAFFIHNLKPYFLENIYLQRLFKTLMFMNFIGLLFYSLYSFKPEIKVLKKIYYSDSINNIMFINSLYEKGHHIILFTSRFMGRNNDNYIKAKKDGFIFIISP